MIRYLSLPRHGVPRFGGKLLLAGFLALSISACASSEPEYVELPVEELYNTAMNSLLEGEYVEAARLFDEVERQHPYSVWASKAQLMAARYCPCS